MFYSYMVIRVVKSGILVFTSVLSLTLDLQAAFDPEPVAPTTQDLKPITSLSEIKKQQDELLNQTENKSLLDNLVEDLEVEQDTAKAELLNDVSFLLTGVKITGNNVLTKEDVTALIQPKINKQVTSAELKDIAAKLTLILQQKGYRSSKAFVPAQQIQNGVVEFKIEEDLLANIHVLGKNAFKYDEALFYQYFDDLKGKIIHTPTLIERLKYLNFLPGTRIKPTLKKLEYGKSVLVLVLEPVDDFTSLSINNNASKYQGDLRTVLSTVVANPTGRSDTLSFFAAINPEFPKYFSSLVAKYSVPYGEQGGKLQFHISQLDYQIDPDAVGQNLLLFYGGSNSFSLSYEKPFWLDLGTNSWSVGFEKRQSNSQTVNNFRDPLVGNQIGFKWVDQTETVYALNASAQFIFADRLVGETLPAQNVLNLKFTKILEGFRDGTTQEDIDYKQLNNDAGIIPQKGPIGDTRGAVANFWKLYLSYLRRQALPWQATVNFQANVEWTDFDNILSSYDYGGADTGTSGGDVTVTIGRAFEFKQYLDWLDVQLGYEYQFSINTFYPDRNNPLDRKVQDCGGLSDLIPFETYQCETESPFLSTRMKSDNHVLGFKYRHELESFGVLENRATATYTYVF